MSREIKYNGDGLIPCIVQDANDGSVLMLAYMNDESLRLTIESGYAHFWSRSRKKLWKKGESSGHLQEVKGIFIDCDNDTILIKAIQLGPGACHTGHRSCFYRDIDGREIAEKTFSEEAVYGHKSK